MPDDSAQSASSEGEDDSASPESDGESDHSVELLVTSRPKRAGAGSNIQKLIQQEEEDPLAEYFNKSTEDVDSEEDIDFEGDEDEAASDAQLDTSSDDEEQGPSKADDDLEGEKQLRKQERAEKQKKRKAVAGIQTTGAARKKAKIDPTPVTTAQPVTPAPKPKKKSERVSWISKTDEGPVRSSSRKQTMQNKEAIHLRMVEKEKQRVKQMKHMEEAERKRQAAKAPPMTQAERMIEAARTERKNAKSLNRWEESERQRAEAQKAKLEALHNRQLQGPIITLWSGLTRWVNGKLGQVGVREIRQVENDTTGKGGQSGNTDINTTLGNGPSPSKNYEESIDAAPTHTHATTSIQHSAESTQPENAKQLINSGPEHTPGLGLLDGIHYYASLPPQTENSVITGDGQPPSSTEAHLSLGQSEQTEPDPIEHPAAFVEKSSSPLRLEPIKSIPRPIPPGPMVEIASRTFVALRNLDNNALNLPELQNSILLKKRPTKIQS